LQVHIFTNPEGKLLMKSLKTVALSIAIFVLVALLVSIISGCTSSRLTNVWKDPELLGPPMTNMLVVAGKNNPVNRRLWEDEIVSALAEHGVSSTPSYRLFPDSIPNPDQVAASVADKKFDGVMFVRRLPTQLSTVDIPGTVTHEKVTQFDQRTQTYSTFYRDVQQPGYTDTNRVVRHEVMVFTPQKETGHLVWSGTGEMINPASRDAVRSEITGLVIPELANQGIIPAK